MSNQPEVFSITGATSGTTDAQKGRQRIYLLSMGIRTSCFVGSVIATGPLRWALFVGAIALPYFAVIIANAGRERGTWGNSERYLGDSNEAIEATPFNNH